MATYPNIIQATPYQWQLKQLYLEARKLCKEQSWSRAATLLYYVNQHTKNFDQALFELGVAQLSLAYWPGAQECFEHLRERHAWDPDVICNLAITYWQQRKLKPALIFFRFNLKHHPHHTDSALNLASLYVEHNRLSKAILQYNRLVYQHPERIEIRFNLAACLQKQGLLDNAKFHYLTILQQNSAHFDSLYNLSCLFWQQKNIAATKFYLERAQSIQYSAHIEFMLNTMLSKQENFEHHQDYVKNLFKNYAQNYDKHLSADLKYQLPAYLRSYLRDKNYSFGLEIGCGTGLCGAAIKQSCRYLTGVDISTEMLAKAKEKHCYDSLYSTDCLHFLATNELDISCVFALDVSPYVLDFPKIFSFKQINEIIFTIELTDTYPKFFQASGRLSFNADFIEELCQDNNFQILHTKKLLARLQHQQFCELMIYHIKRAAVN